MFANPWIIIIPGPGLPNIAFSTTKVLLEIAPPRAILVSTLLEIEFFYTIAFASSVINIPSLKFLWILFFKIRGNDYLQTLIPDWELKPIR